MILTNIQMLLLTGRLQHTIQKLITLMIYENSSVLTSNIFIHITVMHNFSLDSELRNI